MGIVFAFEDFDFGFMSKFGKASGHHVVESRSLSCDLFFRGSSQLGKSLISAVGDPFRVKGLVCLLVDLPSTRVDPVDDGLVGPEVYSVPAGFISNAQPSIGLNRRTFIVNPLTDSVVKRVRGRGYVLHRHL